MKEIVSKKQLRKFGIIVGLGFPIILGWFFPALAGHGFRSWTLFVGLPFLLLGLNSPGLLEYPYYWWMKIGNILGWFNSRIILGIVFVFVLLPIAFFMRLFGYDSLRKNRKGKTTYREIQEQDHIDLTRIF